LTEKEERGKEVSSSWDERETEMLRLTDGGWTKGKGKVEVSLAEDTDS